jgi:hypothetical protein
MKKQSKLDSEKRIENEVRSVKSVAQWESSIDRGLFLKKDIF